MRSASLSFGVFHQPYRVRGSYPLGEEASWDIFFAVIPYPLEDCRDVISLEDIDRSIGLADPILIGLGIADDVLVFRWSGVDNEFQLWLSSGP